MKYLDTRENSIEDSVTRVLMGEKKLDPVNPTAVKKKFDDRKDKDIDNDGDVDSTDKYLHKRRKAISKAIKGDEKSTVGENVKDIAMMMRDKKYKGRTSAFDAAVKKKYPKEYDTNLNGEERAFVVTGEMEKVFPMDIYPMQLVKECMIGDIEKMERLGIYEVAPEDFALIDYASSSKIEAQTIVRNGLDYLIKETL